jgi:hypothetical protein
MPFIGKQPEVGAYQLIDSITTSATATYALTVDGSAYFPASARNLIVSLNGVTQAPESAYTVSGSDIVFDSALTSSDVIDYIMVIGDAVDIGTPSDGTVGTSQMSYPLGNFSSTGIDDNATSTAITIDSSQNVSLSNDLTVDTDTLVVDSTNNRVGIGTDSPGHLLELKKSLATDTTETLLSLENSNSSGSSTNGVAIDFFASADSDTTPDRRARIVAVEPTASGGDIDLAFHTSASSASAERMRIDSSGNLGIGTSVISSGPASTLHVHSSVSGGPVPFGSESRVTISTNDTAAGDNGFLGSLFFGGQDVSSAQTAFTGAGIVGYSAGDLAAGNITADLLFYTQVGAGAPSEKMRLDSSGNVGIGDDSPTDQLSISKDSGNSIKLETFVGNGNDSHFKFHKARGGSSGPSQIGTTDDLGTITWSGYDGSSFNQAAFIKAKASTNTGDFDASLSFGTSSEAMRIDSTGNLFVGATSQTSTETLNVTASGGMVALFKANQPSSTAVHTAFYNSSGLAAKIDRAGLYTQVSDRSLKHDISDSTLGLKEVLNIPVRSFKWNGSNDYIAAGFIAQELEEALPSAVSTDEDTGLKGRSDGNIVPVLTKAIQEQQAMIETLQAQVAELQGAN